MLRRFRRILVPAVALVAIAAPGLAVADDQTTTGTISVSATFGTLGASTAVQAERTAACLFDGLGEQGQGLVGWVIPVTGGNTFTLRGADTPAIEPSRYGNGQRNFRVGFYRSLPSGADALAEPLAPAGGRIPLSATVAIITAWGNVQPDTAMEWGPICIPPGPLGCWLTTVGFAVRVLGTPLRTRFDLEMPQAPFVFVEHTA